MRTTAFILRHGLLLSCLAVCLTGCRPELDFDAFHSGEASFSGGGENYVILFNSDAGTASVELSASGKWTAEFVNGRAYWCTLSAAEGKRGTVTLTFSVQANGEHDERSASVVFTCKDLKRTVVVTQKQRDAMLLSSDRVELSSDGGSFTVEVMSNVDFSHRIEADGSDWIHPVSTKGLEKSVLTFRVDPNEALDRRVGTLTFSGSAGQEKVSVYQKGEVPTIVISEEAVSLEPEDGLFKVEVASNIDATLQIPADCDWLREVKTRTISTNTFLFAYDRNQARTSRSCYLVFQNDSYKKSDSVRVEQWPVEILRDAQTRYVPSVGATLCIETSARIQSFDQFQRDAAWLVPASLEEGEAGNRFFFQVGENPQRTARGMTVQVSCPGFDAPDSFQVVQFSLYPSFSYLTAETDVSAPDLDTDIPYLILWGDGTHELYDKTLRHHYDQAGTHTVRVEGASFPLILLPAPKDGMRYDFSLIRQQ